VDPTKQETPPPQQTDKLLALALKLEAALVADLRRQGRIPKLSLPKLDDTFLADMDNEGLDPTVRLFAGRLHQLTLLVQALVVVRLADLRQINGNFKRVNEALAGDAPEAEPAAAQPAADPVSTQAEPPSPVQVPVAAEVPAEEAPPMVADKDARMAALQRKAAEKNAAARAKKGGVA
jgi:hypothetical protein